MSEKDKRIMETFGKVIPQLSEAKKEYLLGLGDGMALAKTAQAEARARDPADERESA